MTYIGPQTPLRGIYSKPDRTPSCVPTQHLDRLPIIAFDPGGTTGWSLLNLKAESFDKDDFLNVIRTKRSWFHGEIDCLGTDLNKGIWEIKRMIDIYPSAAVVFEDFWVRQLAVDLAPIKIISAVQQHLWEHGRKMFIQSASQAKTMATNERLKLWNVYERSGALGHARDADRHALLFVRKCLGDKELRQELWPHVFTKSSNSKV